MRKKYGSRALSMRAYFEQQASSSAIPESCRMLFKCDESSGFPVNSVNGEVYNPQNLVTSGGGLDGYVEYAISNAIRFEIDSNGNSVRTIFNQTFNTRKVIIIAAHILPIVEASGFSPTRIQMGVYGNPSTGDSPALSLSFSGTMHAQFDITGNGEAGALVTTVADATARIISAANPLTIYVMWNGLGSSASVNGTLTAKVLNPDGSVYNNGTTASSKTAAGLITSDTFTPGNMMRPTAAHYYKMEAWQLDYLPLNLDLQLATWGTIAREGNKGAVILK